MATKKKGARIPTNPSPLTGAPAIPGSSGYDPFGYALGGGPHGHPFRGHHFLRRLFHGAPPFLSDMGMYNTALGTLNDILARRGAANPEALQREQAMLESQRQQGQDIAAAQGAAAGVDPGSIQAMLNRSGIEQGGDIAQQNARFQNAQAQEQRMREDLNLVTPWMNMLFGYTGPRHRQQAIAPAPVGQGGTNWAGVGANLLGSFVGSPAFSNAVNNWTQPTQYPSPPSDWFPVQH